VVSRNYLLWNVSRVLESRLHCIGLQLGFHRANWHSPATLTEVFPCFFLSCKANSSVYLAKTGHDSHSSYLVNCVVLCNVCVDCVVLCTVCV
jgi:hypothetical protein